MERPLILVTNDAGIDSAGLWAAVEALLPLGEVVVAAPDRRSSGVAGRPLSTTREVNGTPVVTYGVDAGPVLAVAHGVMALAPRRPALAVSGINVGVHLGADAHVSDTVRAALEAGVFGIPAMTVSLEVGPAHHLAGGDAANYSAAMAFTQGFARRLLVGALLHGANALNINIPSDATACTRWQITRLSRRRRSLPLPPDHVKGRGRPGYTPLDSASQAEPDSDIWALEAVRIVSVTPLSPDVAAAHPDIAEDFMPLAA